MSTDLTRLDAATLASRIHAGDLSSVEVTQAHLDRIGAVDGDYNAFLHVAGEQALDAAREVARAVAAGETPASSLAGVPIALKDVFTTTDMPTTCGSKILEGWVSPYDATLTTNLTNAGAIIIAPPSAMPSPPLRRSGWSASPIAMPGSQDPASTSPATITSGWFERSATPLWRLTRNTRRTVGCRGIASTPRR